MALFGGIKKAVSKMAGPMNMAGAAGAKVKSRARGPMSAIMTKTAVAVPSAKGMGKPKGMMGKLINEAIKKKPLGLKNGGMSEDKAGRALGKKTADSMGRAMTSTAMKKGGMAKKKKC
jgi:hypothetical protein